MLHFAFETAKTLRVSQKAFDKLPLKFPHCRLWQHHELLQESHELLKGRHCVPSSVPLGADQQPSTTPS
eukprot:c6575_g1_i1 orf=271-477(+)